MDTRIVLGGGGDAAQSHDGHAVFAGWLGTGPRVLYLPIAMGRDPELLSSAARWMNETFALFGVDHIHTVLSAEEVTRSAINAADGVYIGGGNAFLLLYELLRSGSAGLLREAALGGVPFYGGSAGAIILGLGLRTAAHLDENEIGLTDTKGLDLADGCSVWPHYTAEWNAAIETHVRTTRDRVIAIPEASAVIVEGARVRALGQDVRLYTVSGHSEIPRYRPPGASYDSSTTKNKEGAP